MKWAPALDKLFREQPLHVFFLIGFFLLYNLRELELYVTFGEIAGSLFTLLAVAAMPFLALRLLRFDTIKAGVAVSALAMLVLFYSDIFYALKDLLGEQIIRHRILIPVCGLVWGILLLLLRKPLPQLIPLNHYLSLLFLILVLVEAGRTGMLAAQGPSWEPYISLEGKRDIKPAAVSSADLPDIYFILLDGYTSSASLQRYWNFDNSTYEQLLAEQGFEIAANAKSNYNETLNSLSSMLNMRYLEDYRSAVPNEITQNTIARTWIKNNEVVQALANKGYQVQNFSLFDVGDQPYYQEFDYLMLHGVSFWKHWFKKTVAGRVIADTYYTTLLPTKAADVLQLTAELKPAEGQPTFVYSHVLMPHRPYYYDADGTLYPDGEGPLPGNEPANYLEQLQHCNMLVLTMVETITEHNPEAIIIVQGDHGFRALPNPTDREQEGYTTFCAVRAPGKSGIVYNGMTPVNLFRNLLPQILKTEEMPRLEDRQDTSMRKMD